MSPQALRPYYSRALADLEKAIAAEKDGREAFVLQAKRASLLAQGSNIEQSKTLVRELRKINAGFDPRLTAWAMYCDGIILNSEYFDNRKAVDRLKMAHIFGGAANDAELAGASAAWLASCYFNLGEIDQTTNHLDSAFKWSKSTSHLGYGRALLTLADALAWAGSEELSRKCYSKSRHHSSMFGDIVMQNAAIYNSAAFRVSEIMLSECEGVRDEVKTQLALTETESSFTLNALIGNSSNGELLSLLQGELYSALGDHVKAEKYLDEYLTSTSAPSELNRYTAKLLAHRAYCRAGQGKNLEAAADIEQALSLLDSCKDLDDLAVTHFRLAQTLEMLGEVSASSGHKSSQALALSAFREVQRSKRPQLDQIARTVLE